MLNDTLIGIGVPPGALVQVTSILKSTLSSASIVPFIITSASMGRTPILRSKPVAVPLYVTIPPFSTIVTSSTTISPSCCPEKQKSGKVNLQVPSPYSAISTLAEILPASFMHK